MSVDPGVRRFFCALAWLSKLGAGRLLASNATDQRGFEGSVNFAFGDAADAVWHCRMSSKGVQFAAGPDDKPIGTVRLTADVFLQLLSGRINISTAQMTGRVLVEGDGHCTMLLAGLIGQTRLLAMQPGLRGWLTRRFVCSVLKKSPTRYELVLSPTSGPLA